MTNYERLLDLPLREVLKEFGNPSQEKVSDGFSFMLECDNPEFLPCAICDGVPGGCSTVCNVWFNKESAPDANYNEDVWHNAAEEDPPTSDVTLEYYVLIYGAELPTTLTFDGDEWRDSDGNFYNVKYWRPLPKLPEE